MINSFQYTITQFHKQDLEIIQILEQSREKPYRILMGEFQHIQILFIGTLLNQLIYPNKKFLENLQI